jgi:hypothetical protein
LIEGRFALIEEGVVAGLDPAIHPFQEGLREE